MASIRQTFNHPIPHSTSLEARPLMITESDPLEELDNKKRSYDNLLENRQQNLVI